MENGKIGIIGHFCFDGERMDGQTVKTKELNKYIEEFYQEETNKFDTYKNSRNLYKLLKGVYKVVKKSDNIILIVSSRGYKILLPLILFFNVLYHKKVFDFVIGGSRYKIFDKNKILKRMAQKVDQIYLETDKIRKEYEDRGFRNVKTISNFKNVKAISKEEIIRDFNKTRLKFCTFSRVNKAKGIEESIKAIKMANEKMKKNVFELDIYGEIDKEYEKEFESIVNKFPDFINYKGCVDSKEAINILKSYDMMLFLTYWRAEGFPGSLIDALFSGLPVIATNWNYNFDILKDEKTGYKVKIKEVEEVANKIIEIYKNQLKLVEMKYNCIDESDKYSPDKVMRVFIEDLENTKEKKDGEAK